MSKKGLSQIISAVILIGIGVILAGIIFLWANTFLSVLSSPALSCNEVNFKTGVFCEEGNCFLDIVNRGNVALYGFVVKSVEEGTVIVDETLETFVEAGDSDSIELSKVYEVGDRLSIVPIVLDEKGEESICADNYGIEISV